MHLIILLRWWASGNNACPKQNDRGKNNRDKNNQGKIIETDWVRGYVNSFYYQGFPDIKLVVLAWSRVQSVVCQAVVC